MNKMMLGMLLLCFAAAMVFAGGEQQGGGGGYSDSSSGVPDAPPSTPSSGTSAGPAGTPRLVVPPFEKRGTNLGAGELNNLHDFLINSFINTGRFDVPDRNALALLSDEHQFQLDDWADEQKTTEMGKVLNADYIVRVILMHDGEANVFMARILDVKNARGLAAEAMEFTTQRDARGKMDEFVGRILQRIGGRGPGVSQPAAETRKVYKIGDRGPAGGLVFYDRGIFSNGWRYLEAAPAETEFRAEWGAYKEDISGTVYSPGSGKQNTQTIIERLRQLGETEKAAQLCAELDFNGYRDWFLPSKDELNLMYTNLQKKGKGGFSKGWYWSSSQYGNYSAWTQNFGDGRQNYYSKNRASSVRAVRAF
jgi:hypothetical protein